MLIPRELLPFLYWIVESGCIAAPSRFSAAFFDVLKAPIEFPGSSNSCIIWYDFLEKVLDIHFPIVIGRSGLCILNCNVSVTIKDFIRTTPTMSTVICDFQSIDEILCSGCRSLHCNGCQYLSMAQERRIKVVPPMPEPPAKSA